MKTYGVILADPPWRYELWSERGQGSAEKHYPTMKNEDICALPVKDIAAKDCALFLWVTMPKLRESFEVLDAWGFQFKSVAFVWVKTNPKSGTPFFGLGHWTRANAELCLLATKGHPRRVSKSVHQIIMSPIRRHSQKPDEARERIEELMGNVPRIELFARETPPGWDVWGNEVENSIEL